MVDYPPPSEDDTPLTPPGPEMRKVLEESVVKKTTMSGKEEEFEKEKSGGDDPKGWIDLEGIKEDLKTPELKPEEIEAEIEAEEPRAELEKEGEKRVSFEQVVKEEIIVEEPKEEHKEYVKEEAKEENKEENTVTVNEAPKEVAVTVDQDSKNDNNDDTVLSISEENHAVEIYEDTIDDEDNEDDPPPEATAVVAATSGVVATTTSSVEAEESISSSGETESSSGETESSSDTEEEEEEEDEEEENVAPYVAAAVVGAATAGGAAAAAASAKEEPDVEMGSDPTTETQTANDSPSPEPSIEEEDFSNPEDETGEQFNLANEEHRNEVVPPPPQDDLDEEQGLQLNTEDGTVAGAPLSPIAEKSVETNDPSFASAATATRAVEVADSTNDEQQRRVSSTRKSSCCKRHKCLTLFFTLMVLFVIAAAVLIILFFFGPLKHPVSNESSRKGTPGLCDVWDLGPFYQTECETCTHTVAMDGDTGLIARGGEGREDESIQFISNFGTYLPLQTLPFISHGESALLGSFAALGDPNAEDGLGTVYTYERDSAGVWSDVWNITPESLNGEEAKFGTAIVLNADKMVVGAPGDTNEASTGSIYVFGRGDDGNWVEEAKLYLPDVVTGNFGSAVALQGDTLVVADASFPGTVYVYQYDSTTNSWEQPNDGTFTSADCRSTFGMSVGATDGGGVLIECPKEATGAGAVYYYTPSSDGSGYELHQKVTAFNEEPLPALGGKIVVDKDRLLVTTDAKSGFVFELDVLGDWKEAASIAAPAGANNFGADAALFGDHIFLSYDGNTHSYILDC